ncbi:MAG TPA: sporulation protein YqfD [Clostridiales bacterium]|nr:sporulation protein YqfD [Clostridiales bacterium]
MLVRFFQWLRGYLYVRIRGTAPERFINLCCNKNIGLWELARVKEDYQFRISIKNFKKLRPIARKTGIVPHITRKVGFPFFLHRYRKRKGFVLGLLACAVLVYILSLYVWDINLEGGSKYTADTMLQFLQEKDVYAGILKRKVNCQEIEETIRLAYNDIGWVSAEMKGTRLIINITETNMPAPAQKALQPSHIVATKDAMVKSIITRTGTPLVREGSVVKKGDILVSGIVPVMDDFGVLINQHPVVADSDIVCKTYYDYKEVFPLAYTYKNYTGSTKKGYYVSFLLKKLFLYNPRYSYNTYDIIVNEKSIHITDSFYLPFRYGTITAREYTEEKKTYTKEEAVSIAEARLEYYFEQLRKHNVIITQNNVKITVENNKCIAQGRILVEEPAWEYKTIIEDEWRLPQTDEHSGNDN